MAQQKIFILLPDGVGLRNFAFTEFCTIGNAKGFDLVFWNNTAFDLSGLGLQQVRIGHAKNHPLTEVYKNARKEIELNLNIKKSGDPVYDSYRFPYPYKNLKTAFKNMLVHGLTFLNSSDKGLSKIREKIKTLERNTPHYQRCLATLQKEKPGLVFCTNQRHTSAIAPILAAQDLGIPTASFIFSWDNLPKATMVIETDYYFVWSNHMKSELRYYYPQINENQVFISGTPQFESHFNSGLLSGKADFFATHQLDLSKKYLCYSGDDVTTSPHDAQYLSDVADAVRKLNKNGHQLGIVFRRCPVDFSNRYDAILEKNKDIITPIVPKWENIGQIWNSILPTKEDLILQINTIFYTEMVINLGSSMAFDYAAFGKPCAFMNYNIPDGRFPGWSVERIYNYVHFRSMPDQKAVIWLNSPEEIAGKIENTLLDSKTTVSEAIRWFEKINAHPAHAASERIFEGFKQIMSK